MSSAAPAQSAHKVVPDPEVQPTLTLWPEVADILGLGRSAVYEAAGRGELPVLRFGKRMVVPTAALRKLLGLDS
jgi:excisionase family DNA binding protein